MDMVHVSLLKRIFLGSFYSLPFRAVTFIMPPLFALVTFYVTQILLLPVSFLMQVAGVVSGFLFWAFVSIMPLVLALVTCHLADTLLVSWLWRCWPFPLL